MSEFVSSPDCIMKVKYKIDHISKTKHRTKILMNSKIRFRILRIFFVFVAEWIKKIAFQNDYILKTGNSKIDFPFVSEQCGQKMETALFEEGGGGCLVCISIIKNNPNFFSNFIDIHLHISVLFKIVGSQKAHCRASRV